MLSFYLYDFTSIRWLNWSPTTSFWWPSWLLFIPPAAADVKYWRGEAGISTTKIAQLCYQLSFHLILRQCCGFQIMLLWTRILFSCFLPNTLNFPPTFCNSQFLVIWSSQDITVTNKKLASIQEPDLVTKPSIKLLPKSIQESHYQNNW